MSSPQLSPWDSCHSTLTLHASQSPPATWNRAGRLTISPPMSPSEVALESWESLGHRPRVRVDRVCSNPTSSFGCSTWTPGASESFPFFFFSFYVERTLFCKQVWLIWEMQLSFFLEEKNLFNSFSTLTKQKTHHSRVSVESEHDWSISTWLIHFNVHSWFEDANNLGLACTSVVEHLPRLGKVLGSITYNKTRTKNLSYLKTEENYWPGMEAVLSQEDWQGLCFISGCEI